MAASPALPANTPGGTSTRRRSSRCSAGAASGAGRGAPASTAPLSAPRSLAAAGRRCGTTSMRVAAGGSPGAVPACGARLGLKPKLAAAPPSLASRAARSAGAEGCAGVVVETGGAGTGAAVVLGSGACDPVAPSGPLPAASSSSSCSTLSTRRRRWPSPAPLRPYSVWSAPSTARGGAAAPSSSQSNWKIATVPALVVGSGRLENV